MDFNEAPGSELSDAFPHDGLADLEVRGKFGFGRQQIARTQPARDDHIHQLGGDDLKQALPAWRGRQGVGSLVFVGDFARNLLRMRRPPEALGDICSHADKSILGGDWGHTQGGQKALTRSEPIR